MSLVYHFASSKDLPLGAFGGYRENNVYQTLEEAAGIYVQKSRLQPEISRKLFKYPFVYEVMPNFGKFIIVEELKFQAWDIFRANRRCIGELWAYLRQNINTGEEIEFYTGYDSGDGVQGAVEFSEVIDLSTFILGDDFGFKMNQYLLITKSRS